jgi:hypothetical protein
LSPASVEKALELTHQNPELAAWFEEAQSIDAVMIGAFHSIEPPADLHAKIMAAARPHLTGAGRSDLPHADTKVDSGDEDAALMALGEDDELSSPGKDRVRATGRVAPSVWLALAASVIIALGAGYFFLAHDWQAGLALPFTVISSEVPRLTANHHHAFGSKRNDMGEIRTWLAANGGTPQFDLPESLKGFVGVNCEVTDIRGVRVSVICLAMKSGRIVHLYVMDRARLANSPPLGHADFSQIGSYALASWSDETHSYILSEPGDTEKLKSLMEAKAG